MAKDLLTIYCREIATIAVRRTGGERAACYDTLVAAPSSGPDVSGERFGFLDRNVGIGDEGNEFVRRVPA